MSSSSPDTAQTSGYERISNEIDKVIEYKYTSFFLIFKFPSKI